MGITTTTFIKNASSFLEGFSLIDTDGSEPRRTVVFEKKFPFGNITIQVMGPCITPSSGRQQVIIAHVLCSNLPETENPAVEFATTATYIGWEKRLAEKMQLLEQFIEEKDLKCPKCNSVRIPKQQRFNDDKDPKYIRRQLTFFCCTCDETEIVFPDNAIRALNSALRKGL